jgi:hypothetical protein
MMRALLLLLATPAAAPFVPATFTELRAALESWNDDPIAAAGTYGAVGAWNVSAVYSFRALVLDLGDLNDALPWSTGHVTAMGDLLQSAESFNSPLPFDTSSAQAKVDRSAAF